MTSSPDSPRLVFDDIQSAVALLRERGLRLSAARRLVLEGLFAAEGPVSAEEIAGGLSGRLPETDVTSVYRNLEMLQELGLVRHVHLGHGPGRYALAGGPEREFLVCERCGEVRGVEPADLDRVRAQIRRAFGFRARFSHFPITGLCPRCDTGMRPEKSRDERGSEPPGIQATDP